MLVRVNPRAKPVGPYSRTPQPEIAFKDISFVCASARHDEERLVVPKLLRDRHSGEVDILLHLRRRARPDDNARNGRMTQRELDGRRRERNAMMSASDANPLDCLNNLLRGRAVVVRRTSRKDAAVKDASSDHFHVALRRKRQERLRSRAIEQRMPSGEKDDIDEPGSCERECGLDLVGTDADLGGRSAQGGDSCHRLLHVILRIVHENEIDVIESHARDAFVERSHHPLGREVGGSSKRQRTLKERIGETGNQELPDLRRQHELVTRPGSERRAEPALREARSVERRRVEVTNADLPRPVDRRTSGRLVQLREQSSERRGAEADRLHVDTVRPKRGFPFR